MNCRTCQWFDAMSSGHVGSCRRYPPTVIPYHKEGSTQRDTTEWPVVEAEDWCGEHKHKGD